MEFKNKKSSPNLCDISPVCKSSEIGVTPRRRRRKASKREQNCDVHSSTMSTPISHHSSQVSCLGFNSPSASFPCSQDIRPDVVWDYSSPKPAHGAKKKEIKLTIKEFLEKLNSTQTNENNTRSKQMLLLENWLNQYHSNRNNTKIVSIQRKKKKGSRQAVEKLKLFLESIQGVSNEADMKKPKENNRCDNTPELKETKGNVSKDFFGDNSSDNDSMEELWGDCDNSFIVKATQELESVENSSSQNGTSTLTIPETNPVSAYTMSQLELAQTNSTELSEKCVEILTQLANIDWDSDLESDGWEEAFLAEDDSKNGTHKSSIQNSDYNTKALFDFNSTEEENSNEVPIVQSVVASSADLFDSDSFEDDSLFLEPEVLSQINEIESQYSQQTRCSPQEIQRKKDEALKKRKKYNLR